MIRSSLLISMFLLSACAQVGVPTGGGKDTEPPKVISAYPELGTMNVGTQAGGSITLEFDEFVNVRQLSTQLLVSPPLKQPVEWIMRGKEVSFYWNEELEKDRTYVFQFGEAVVDLREANPVSNLLHAFSTGSNIDTLSLHGRVVDAFTGEALDDRKIFLFDSALPIDSIVDGALPMFVGSTNKGGEFAIKYLQEGEYRIIAIDDADRNYKWTDGEALAIHEELIVVSGADTISKELRMQKTADTEVKYFVNSKLDSLGLAHIEMSSELEDLSDVSAGSLHMFLEAKDLWIWDEYSTIENGGVVWDGADTLQFVDVEKSAAESFTISHGPTGKIISGSKTVLKTNRPVIEVVDSLFITMRSDSSLVQIDSIYVGENPFELNLAAKFGRGETLVLDILPGALKGWGGSDLVDTLQFKWSTFVSTDLAELLVDIDKAGWLELISANGTIVETVPLKEGLETIQFKNLTPGSYALRWLGDENSNGVWDGVSLKNWSEPESARVLPSNIKVKADWSHTLNWE